DADPRGTSRSSRTPAAASTTAPASRTLLAMHKPAGGKGLVLPMLSWAGGRAQRVEGLPRLPPGRGRHAARPLHGEPDADPDPPPVVSLRDIGITWRLWRGDNPFEVQRNAGHKRFPTTEKYVGDIEKLNDDCGVPFPLLASKFASKETGPVLQPTGTDGESAASPEGVEPSLAT